MLEAELLMQRWHFVSSASDYGVSRRASEKAADTRAFKLLGRLSRLKSQKNSPLEQLEEDTN